MAPSAAPHKSDDIQCLGNVKVLIKGVRYQQGATIRNKPRPELKKNIYIFNEKTNADIKYSANQNNNNVTGLELAG